MNLPLHRSCRVAELPKTQSHPRTHTHDTHKNKSGRNVEGRGGTSTSRTVGSELPALRNKFVLKESIIPSNIPAHSDSSLSLSNYSHHLTTTHLMFSAANMHQKHANVRHVNAFVNFWQLWWKILVLCDQLVIPPSWSYLHSTFTLCHPFLLSIPGKRQRWLLYRQEPEGGAQAVGWKKKHKKLLSSLWEEPNK